MLNILIKEAEEREKKNAEISNDGPITNDKAARNYKSFKDQEMVDIDEIRQEPKSAY